MFSAARRLKSKKGIERKLRQRSSFTLDLFFLPPHQHNCITITSKKKKTVAHQNIRTKKYSSNLHEIKCLYDKKGSVCVICFLLDR